MNKSVLDNHKKLSHEILEETNKERILRKTTVHEIIERPFTTEPKTHRIRRGHTIVIRRAQRVMKHLWQMGFRHYAQVTHEPIENAIFYCVGGDYRTIKKYLGFRITTRKGNAVEPPQTRYIPGYLEKLHYIDRVGNGKYRLCHEVVPLPYHYHEGLISDASFVCNHESSSSKEVLCVRSEAMLPQRSSMGKGPLGPINKETTNKHNTHTNHTQIKVIRNPTLGNIPKSESILSAEELRILKASRREG